MSDDRTFDDDRLLAFALGFGDDPELEAAAAGDEALRTRLAAMRADLGAVTAGLDRVVPAPPDEYTDLRDERWDELRGMVAAPAAAHRRPVWLRVLVPVAVLAVVLVAGVAGLQTLDLGAGGETSLTSAEKADDGADRESGGVGQGAAVPGAADEYSSPSPTAGALAYDTVVVAVAKAPAGGRQVFEVVRTLRGTAGSSVSLGIAGRALPQGAAALLYLQPTGIDSSDSAPAQPVLRGTPPPVTGRALRYTFRGEPAWAWRLPAGVGPEDVALP